MQLLKGIKYKDPLYEVDSNSFRHSIEWRQLSDSFDTFLDEKKVIL